jgi:ParB family transcriptional regulator, chromosome partitioning protein
LGTTYVHPAALFALSEAEIALHAETPRGYSWSPLSPGADAQDIDGDAGGEGERQDNVDLSDEQERHDDGADDGAAIENAPLDRGVEDKPR